MGFFVGVERALAQRDQNMIEQQKINLMKKNIFYIFLLSIISFNSYSQTDNFEIQKSIYEKAKAYNDPNVAINALYNMVARSEEHTSELQSH